MGEGKYSEDYSRRRFLKSGRALLASGSYRRHRRNGMAQSKHIQRTPPALPWPWARSDPLEAGSRAYRYYLDIGG